MSANAGLFVALYENNLHTNVRAGENSGRRMEHAFVVHRLIGPYPFDSKGQARVEEALKLKTEWKTADLGAVAFVQELNGPGILQALALDMCR
jgi:hypothetical protein